MDYNIAATFDEYSDSLYKLAFSYLINESDAEDVVQDVFMTLLSKQPCLENKTHLKAWLIRVTVNKCKNKLRATEKKNTPLDENTVSEYYDSSHEIADAVESLKPKYRIPLYLFYYEDMTIRQISATLRLSESAIKSRLERARKQLKEILE